MKHFQWLFLFIALLNSSLSFSDLWYEARGGISNSGPSFGAQINYAKDTQVFTFGASESTTSCFWFCYFEKDEEQEYREFYIAYGYRKYGSWYTSVIQTGLGVYKEKAIMDCDSDDSACVNETKSTVGIPIDISATIGRYAGLGVNLHFNLNEYRPLAAFRISYSLGKFN